ncbi:MAG: 30S ribosomal protein S6 [Bryobacteraceae bacterium]|nr:30S ribosomal protein S6 [Bryobacteraceae bacterium]
MNRIYEEMFIVRPDATDEVIDPLVEIITKEVLSKEGTVDKIEKWGKRRLAYKVEKLDHGFYVLVQFTCPASAVKEIERRLRVQDAVLKFMTVRIDERLKVADKRKKKADKRAARKPPPPVMPPAAPLVPGAVLPAAPAPAMPAAPLPAAPVAEAPVVETPVVEAPVVAAPDSPAAE